MIGLALPFDGAEKTDYSTDPANWSLLPGTASKMFSKPEAEVTDSERSVAKMINFGISYGITPVGLFTRLKPQGVNVTLEQCDQFIKDYFKWWLTRRLLTTGGTRNDDIRANDPG